MSTPVLVAVAWPYASGSRHLGHLAGAYLPADIFARQQRMAGNEVLMVSGSDVHGTPITVRAEAEGVAPDVIVDRYHSKILRQWDELGMSWDLYTTTGTENQNGGVGSGNLFHLVKNVFEGGAVADDALKIVLQFDLRLQVSRFGLQLVF